MPTPAYIICSQSGTEDAATGAVSVFNILEKIRFSRVLTPGGTPLVIHVTAAWIRKDDEEGKAFEFSVDILGPQSEAKVHFGEQDFKFATPHQRIVVKLGGFVL